MCDSLGIQAKPNNGTLRLPLKPIGLHSDKHNSIDQDLPDLPTETSHINNSPTEVNEPKVSDSPAETNVRVGEAPASVTKPVDPVETDILITAPPEGILQRKQVDVLLQTDSSQTKINQKRRKN